MSPATPEAPRPPPDPAAADPVERRAARWSCWSCWAPRSTCGGVEPRRGGDRGSCEQRFARAVAAAVALRVPAGAAFDQVLVTSDPGPAGRADRAASCRGRSPWCRVGPARWPGRDRRWDVACRSAAGPAVTAHPARLDPVRAARDRRGRAGRRSGAAGGGRGGRHGGPRDDDGRRRRSACWSASVTPPRVPGGPVLTRWSSATGPPSWTRSGRCWSCSLGGGLAVLAASLAVGSVYAGRALVPIRESLRRQREFAADASPRAPDAAGDHAGRDRGAAARARRTRSSWTARWTTWMPGPSRLESLVDDLLLLARADADAVALADDRYGPRAGGRRGGRGRSRRWPRRAACGWRWTSSRRPCGATRRGCGSWSGSWSTTRSATRRPAAG